MSLLKNIKIKILHNFLNLPNGKKSINSNLSHIHLAHCNKIYWLNVLAMKSNKNLHFLKVLKLKQINSIKTLQIKNTKLQNPKLKFN